MASVRLSLLICAVLALTCCVYTTWFSPKTQQLAYTALALNSCVYTPVCRASVVPIPGPLKAWLHEAIPQIPVLTEGPLGFRSVDPLEFVLKHGLANSDGLWLEFGVHGGASINRIAGHAPEGKTVYGFDSFVGLPEDFFVDRSGKSKKTMYPKGFFDRGGALPNVPHNVELVKGWFNDTLPVFLANHRQDSVSLLHIDSDLYSSASTILRSLHDRLRTGAIIVFDELINFPDYGDHEARALFEFLQASDRQAHWIGARCPAIETPRSYPSNNRCCAVAVRLS